MIPVDVNTLLGNSPSSFARASIGCSFNMYFQGAAQHESNHLTVRLLPPFMGLNKINTT